MGEYGREQRNQLSRAIANNELSSKQLKRFVDNRKQNITQMILGNSISFNGRKWTRMSCNQSTGKLIQREPIFRRGRTAENGTRFYNCIADPFNVTVVIDNTPHVTYHCDNNWDYHYYPLTNTYSFRTDLNEQSQRAAHNLYALWLTVCREYPDDFT